MKEDTTKSDERQQKYWGFISYSRADERWAKWLQDQIESYRIPKSIRTSEMPKRLRPVFRDTEDLRETPDLGPTITEALRESRKLLVVCSPNSAVSKWVDTEVRTFKAMGRDRNIHCLIVNGEPNATTKSNASGKECYAEALRFRVDTNQNILPHPVDPGGADVRGSRASRRKALMRLIAGILEIDFDKIWNREKRRRRIQFLQTVGLCLATLLTGWILLSGQRSRFMRLLTQTTTKLQEEAEANLTKQQEEAKANLTKQQEEAKANLTKRQEEANANLTKQQEEAKANLKTSLERKDVVAKADLLKQQALARLGIQSQPDKTVPSLAVERASSKQAGEALAFLAAAVRLNPSDEDNPFYILKTLARNEWLLPTAILHVQNPPGSNSINFTNDGRWLLINQAEGSAIYNSLTGEKFPIGEKVDHLEVSKERSCFAGIAGTDADVWAVTTDKPERIGRVVASSTIACANLSKDGKRLVTGTEDAKICIWDTSSGNIIGAPTKLGEKPKFVQFSPDDSRVLAVSTGGFVFLLDPETGKIVDQPPLSGGDVSVEWGLDGKWLLIKTSSHDQHTTQVWDCEHHAFFSEGDRVKNADFNEDGSLVHVQSDNGNHDCDARTGYEAPAASPEIPLNRFVLRLGPHFVRSFNTAESVERQIRLPEGSRVLGITPDKHSILTLKGEFFSLYDLESGREIFSSPAYPSENHDPDDIRSVTISPSGHLFGFLRGKDTLEIRSLKDGALMNAKPMTHPEDPPDIGRAFAALAIFNSHDEKPAAFVSWTFGKDEKTVLALVVDEIDQSLGGIYEYDIISGEGQRLMLSPTDNITSFETSPDAARLVTASEFSALSLVRSTSGQNVGGTIVLPKSALVRAVSQDGSLLAYVNSGTVTCKRTSDSSLLHEFQVTADIAEIAFSRDNKSIAIRDREGNVSLLDTASWNTQPLCYQTNHLQISSDRKSLFAVADQVITTWDLATAQLVRKLDVGVTGDIIVEPIERAVLVRVEKDHWRLWDLDTGEIVAQDIKTAGHYKSFLLEKARRRILFFDKEPESETNEEKSGGDQAENTQPESETNEEKPTEDQVELIDLEKDTAIGGVREVTGDVTGAYFSHDRRKLAIASNTGSKCELLIIDAATGIADRKLVIEGNGITDISFTSDDNRVLLKVSHPGLLSGSNVNWSAWDLINGDEIALPYLQGDERYIHISKDGGIAQTIVAKDSTVESWDLLTDKRIRVSKIGTVLEEFDSELSSEDLVAVKTGGTAVSVFSAADFHPILGPVFADTTVRLFSPSETTPLLISEGDSNLGGRCELQIFTSGKKRKFSFDGSFAGISEDGNSVLLTSEDKIALVDIGTGRQRLTRSGTYEIRSLIGNIAVVTKSDGDEFETIECLNLGSGTVCAYKNRIKPGRLTPGQTSNSVSTESYELSGDGALLIVDNDIPLFEIVDPKTHEAVSPDFSHAPFDLAVVSPDHSSFLAGRGNSLWLLKNDEAAFRRAPIQIDSPPGNIVFSPDSKQAAIESVEHNLQFVDLTTGSLYGLATRLDNSSKYEWARKSNLYVETSAGTSWVWQWRSGRKLIGPIANGTLEDEVPDAGDRPMDISGDERFLALGTKGAIRVLDLSTGTEIRRLRPPDDSEIRCVSFSNDENLLLCHMVSGMVSVLDWRRGRSVFGPAQAPDALFLADGSAQPPAERVPGALFLPDSRRLAIFPDPGNDAGGVIRDIFTGKIVYGPFKNTTGSAEGDLMALWTEGAKNFFILSLSIPEINREVETVSGLRSVGFDPSSRVFASADDERLIKTWSPKGVLVGEPIRAPFPIQSVVLVRHGMGVVARMNDSGKSTLAVWDRDHPYLPPVTHEFGDDRSFGLFRVEPGGERIIVQASSDTKIWDVQTNKLKRIATGDQLAARNAELGPDGFSILADGKITSLDHPDEQPIELANLIEDAEKPVWDWRADKVLQVSSDLISVWKLLQSGAQKKVLTPLQRIPATWGAWKCASFDPTGDFICAGTADGNVILFSVKDGLLVAPPLRCDSKISGLVFSPDGDRIAVVLENSDILTVELRHAARSVTESETMDQTQEANITNLFETAAKQPFRPEWLAEIAESAGGLVVKSADDQGATEKIPTAELTERLQRIRGGEFPKNSAGEILAWFFADLDSRTIAPWENTTSVQLAASAAETGQLENLRQSFALRPKVGSLAKLAALELQSAGTSSLAQFDFAAVLAGGEQNASNWSAYGDALEKSGALPAAVRAEDHAIRLEPRNKVYLESRGLLLQKLQQHTEAIGDFTTVLTLAPDDAPSHLNRAISYQALGETDAAISDYEKALESAPENVAVQRTIGWLYLEAGHPEKVASHWEQARRFGAVLDAPLVAGLTVVKWRTGQRGEGIKTFWRLPHNVITGNHEALLDLSQSCLETLNEVREVAIWENRAALLRAGDTNDLATFVQKDMLPDTTAEDAVRKGLTFAETFLELQKDPALKIPMLISKSDAKSRSMDAFTKALKLAPKSEPVHRFFGWALFCLGENTRAYEEWRIAESLAIAPGEDLLAALSIGALVTNRSADARSYFDRLVQLNNNFSRQEFVSALEWPAIEIKALEQVRISALKTVSR
jgi:WD40 repeat protein/Tfp pilus assembly protein PilF